MNKKKENLIVAVIGTRYGELEIEKKVLSPLGCEIVEGPGTSAPSIISVCKGAAGILAGGSLPKFTPEVISSLDSCRIIARYGVGYNNIDTEAARAKGIIVTNVPDYCVDEVSDHAMGLILLFARKLDVAIDEVRKGNWGVAPLRPIQRLRGKCLGIVGVGRIGSALAKKARSFGLKIVVFDPVADDAVFRRLRAERVSFERLLDVSDYISLHAPLTSETRGMFGAAQFERMKAEAILINLARGGLVDEEALAEALKKGKIRGAGLDVLAEEPPGKQNALVGIPNCLITPHTAWYSVDAQNEMRHKAAGEVLRVLRGRDPKFRVA